ncbi:MAG: hypothetical protein ACYTGC_13100, partial [Planctomycetota bacterium]
MRAFKTTLSVLCTAVLAFGASALADSNAFRTSPDGVPVPDHISSQRDLPTAGGCGNCDAGGICDSQVGITGGFLQFCEDGQWTSLAFPINTGGAVVDTVTSVHNTNTGEGDIYITGGTCGGPDVNNILATLCSAIVGEPSGVPVDHNFPPVATSPTDPTWVIMVFRDSFSFDVMFNAATLGTPGAGFGNLSGSPDPAEWQDLNNFGFGACYCVSLSGGPGPDGDECESCIPVGEGVFNGTTADNTGSTGDDTSCAFGDTIDEWYCYTASCTGIATASLCGSGYDTTLAVFDACGGAELACNDDAFEGPCAGTLQSQVTWPVTIGTTYYVRISGFADNTGDYVLDLSCEGQGAVGACCFPDGSCVDGLAQGECTGQGGVYQGDGSDCGGVQCPTGPCPGEGDCCAEGGNGTPGCDDAECCNLICAIDPFCCDVSWDGICANEAQDLCELCSIGACCFPDTSCIDGISQADCEGQGGAYQGDGTTCDDVVCLAPTGGCCQCDGEIQFCTIETEEDCAALDGLYLGNGTACAAGNAYYLDDGNHPWGNTTNFDAMDSVFGVGGWTNEDFGTVDVGALFAPTTSFIFLDGSDGSAIGLEGFLTANQATLEAWVSGGGALLLNSAPNQDNGMSFGFGGVVLTYPDFPSDPVSAVDPGHPIFNGPFLPVATDYTGNSWAHASVSGGGITPLMTDTGGKIHLAELAFGGGGVLFGGMTTPNFHQPQPESFNLRANIVSYVFGLATIGASPCEEAFPDQCVAPEEPRTLIIKQGACPAPVNPNSNGVVPMVLTGDVDFDVTQIDLASLELSRCDGAGGSVAPNDGPP